MHPRKNGSLYVGPGLLGFVESRNHINKNQCKNIGGPMEVYQGKGDEKRELKEILEDVDFVTNFLDLSEYEKKRRTFEYESGEKTLIPPNYVIRKDEEGTGNMWLD